MRKLHAEKRTTIDADYTVYFRKRMSALPEGYSPELVFNMYETCWRLHEALRRDIEEKRKETMKLRSHKSEKTLLTAFGGISCNGEKLPLCVITKGKTERSEVKFGSHPGDATDAFSPDRPTFCVGKKDSRHHRCCRTRTSHHSSCHTQHPRPSCTRTHCRYRPRRHRSSLWNHRRSPAPGMT
jgi:hypothetical protein